MLKPLLRSLPISLTVLLGSIPLATCAAPPKAFTWPASGYWDGADGWWSTFYVRVGTPEKYVRLLPSTTWQETFVVLQDACKGSSNPGDSIRILNPDGDPKLCSDQRGLLSEVNASTSWFPHPPFAVLDLDPTLLRDPPNGNGLYGQDRLGLTISDKGVTLDKQVIAGVVTPDWWVGIFGLGNQPTNFTGFNDPQPSFLQTMFDQGYIPSMTWGYQAGAYYRLKQVQGQVTFGGYDQSRYAPNVPVTFQNSAQQFTLRGISYNTEASSTPYNLLSGDDQNKAGQLDSSVSGIYLPNKTVEMIAQTFNLTFNASLSLYTLTEAQHTKLKKINPTFTFSLSDNTTSEIIKITVPYGAFDLKVGQGYTGGAFTEYYFPLKVATKDSGIVLGRSFMQEVHLFTDYTRGTWQLAQAVWKDSYDEDLITVQTPGNATKTGGGGGTHTAAIAGGTVAGVVAIAALGLVGFLFYRKKNSPEADKKEKEEMLPEPPFAELGGAQVSNPRYEVDGASTTAGTPGVASPIGVGAWSNENKIQAVEIDGRATDGTPITSTPATELSSAEGYNAPRFPQNALVAELDGGAVHVPEMEGSTPRNEEKGFRFGGGRPEMPTPPPPPSSPPTAPPPAGPPHPNSRAGPLPDRYSMGEY